MSDAHQNDQDKSKDKVKGNVIDYTVDDEPQSTTSKELTPTQILGNAGIDPSSHYLVQIKGKEKESYEGKPNEQIHMHEKMKFISVSTGATTVSGIEYGAR